MLFRLWALGEKSLDFPHLIKEISSSDHKSAHPQRCGTGASSQCPHSFIQNALTSGSSSFKKIYYYYYYFLAALGLHCCIGFP